MIAIGTLTLMASTLCLFVIMTKVGHSAATARNAAVRMEIAADGMLQRIRSTLARGLEPDMPGFDHPRFDPWLATVVPDRGVWTYLTRLDIENPGARGPAWNGRPADNVPAEPVRRIEGDGPWYVDSDGDGLQDAVLRPLSEGLAEHPDGTRLYAAVRIVDNAGFNSRHHLKWPVDPLRNRTPIPATGPDPVDGAVDWRPDMPRLPQVNLRGLRNLGELAGAATDNPDGPGDPDRDFDLRADRWMGSDDPATAAALRAAGLPDAPPPFHLSDDLALRMFLPQASMNKYLLHWPTTFSPDTAPTVAAGRLRNDLRRMISGVTRSRTVRWMRGPDNDPASPPELWSMFDLRKLSRLAPSEAAGRLDTLFAWMKGRGILGTDDRRAQFLANLYEYVRADVPASADPDPIVYSGPAGLTPPIAPKTGFSRQPFLNEIIREGDTHYMKKGETRKWSGRFGVELSNPFDTAIDLTKYRLRLESVPFGPLTATSILQPAVDFDFPPGATIAPGGFFWAATDGDADAVLPASCIRMGPRIVISLIRKAAAGDVVVDRVDTRDPTVDGRGLDFRDWETAADPVEQVALIAAANNGWVNMAGIKVHPSRGVRSVIYRPAGETPSHIAGEWLGTAVVSANNSYLRGVGQPLGTAGRANPRQAVGTMGPPATAADGSPLVFAFAPPVPRRGPPANLGELTRLWVVGPGPGKTLSEFLAEASAASRNGDYGPGNSWAHVTGDRMLRFDVYDPTPDPSGRPYANARLLDLVSLYLTASGVNGPFEPVRHADAAGATLVALDDSPEDPADTDADGANRPGYREGLINVNTAPRTVLANLPFPRRMRTGDRVTNGRNVDFAEALRAYTAAGNVFRDVSDVVLWAKTADPAVAGPAWDVLITTPADPADDHILEMADRDAVWSTALNSLTTRSDVYTAYIVVKLMRPREGRPVEDLGEARLVAVLDRTVCRPAPRTPPAAGPANPAFPPGDLPPARITKLPRVLARQYYD
jgi:hypothetical protein